MKGRCGIYISLCAVLLLGGCTFVMSEEIFPEYYEKRAEREHLRPLAEQGVVEAQYRLGLSYCCGIGSYYNNVKALNWFCEAGKRGYSPAQFELGRMYERSYSNPAWDSVTLRRRPARGLFPEKDLLRAYMWFSLAAAEGHANAQWHKEVVEEQLSLEDRMQAQRLLENWQDVPCGAAGYLPWDDKIELP